LPAFRFFGRSLADRIGRADSNPLLLQPPPEKTNRVTVQGSADHNCGMEQSIRKFRPEMGLSMNLMLAVVLVAACSVNALLLLTHL
jgi:hypothetical protein